MKSGFVFSVILALLFGDYTSLKDRQDGRPDDVLVCDSQVVVEVKCGPCFTHAKTKHCVVRIGRRRGWLDCLKDSKDSTYRNAGARITSGWTRPDYFETEKWLLDESRRPRKDLLGEKIRSTAV